MRFVGAFSIAIALLAGDASRGWCQIAIPGPGLPQAAPITAAQPPVSKIKVDSAVRPATASSAAPASPSVEGTWVADDAAATPQPLPAIGAVPYPPQRQIPYAAYYMPVANIYGDPSLMPQGPPGMPMAPGYGPGMTAQQVPPGGYGPGARRKWRPTCKAPRRCPMRQRTAPGGRQLWPRRLRCRRALGYCLVPQNVRPDRYRLVERSTRPSSILWQH